MEDSNRIFSGGPPAGDVDIKQGVIVSDQVTWDAAEKSAASSLDFSSYTCGGKIKHVLDAQADRRDYTQLKKEALAGLVFDRHKLEVIEAFFGGFYAGNDVAKIRLRGVQARALVKERNRITHGLWRELKWRLGQLGTQEAQKALNIAKEVLYQGVDLPPLD